MYFKYCELWGPPVQIVSESGLVAQKSVPYLKYIIWFMDLYMDLLLIYRDMNLDRTPVGSNSAGPSDNHH